MNQYEKCGLTEHEMKCIGLGIPITERLTYAVELRHPKIIGTSKAYYSARSEAEAKEMAQFDRWGQEVVRVTLL